LQRELEFGSTGAPEIHRPKKASERRNVTSNYLLAVVTVLVGFLITPILTHQLGIQRYGVWALIGSLIPFLELLELGFASVTVAFVGRHLELEEHDKVEATLNTSFVILSVLGVIAFVGVGIFTFFLPDIIPTIPKNLVGQAQFLLLLMAFDMALSIPMDTFGGALIALQRYDILNHTLITVLTLQALAWVIVLALHGGLVALGIVTVAISLAGQASRLLIVHRLLPWFRLSLRRFDRALVRTFTSLSGWYSLDQISYAIIDLSDVLIVGAAAGVAAAAVYAVAQRLGPLPVRIVQPRIFTLFTTATELSARDDTSGLRDRTDDVVRFALYLSLPAAIALGFLAGPTVEAWVGPLYREAASVIGLMCVAGIVQAWAFTVKISLGGSRRPKLPATLYGLEAALHVALGIVLASKYGPVGMAWALLIGVVIFEGMLMLPMAYRQLGDSYPRRAIGFVRTLTLPALCTGALAWVLGRPGGPLFVFTDTHGRVAGLALVAVAGLALMGVFYAILLASMPSAQRGPLLARSRVWLGRLRPGADVPAQGANGASASGEAETEHSDRELVTSEVAVSTRVRSFARWIGSADRPIFSWLDLPDDDRVVGAAVLLPSIGLEAEYATRAMRDLAHRLAASGWAVLRVGYPGTGDSCGTWTDADLVADWRRSVREAIEYARELGTPRVAVVGLRLGATLAAAELAAGVAVDDLVLWDPCATGKAFIREQRALWAFRRNQAVEWGTLRDGEEWGSGEAAETGSFEAPGVMLSAQTVSDMQALTIAPGDRKLASRELVLTREGRKVDRALAERRGQAHVEFAEISGQDDLLDAQAITPEGALERIRLWLSESVGHATAVETPKASPVTVRLEGRPAVVERALDIGPAGLFGILSEPEEGTGPSAPTVIFLNAGRIGHCGPARFWVELARSWSSEGVRCLRVDLSGLGDSPTRPQRTENVEFPTDALEDLRDVRRFASVEFGPDIVLVGLCSGGYHVIQSALDQPVASVCLINPALTHYRWGEHPYRRFEPNETLDVHDRREGAPRPWVSQVMARLAPYRSTMRKLPGGWWIMKRLLARTSPSGMFGRLTQSGVRVLVVASAEDVLRLRRGEERRYDELTRSDHFKVESIPNLEHTLLERTGRDRVAELLQAWVVQPGIGTVAPACSQPLQR
jgi:O-antigen/teichoic acid export membrane protein